MTQAKKPSVRITQETLEMIRWVQGVRHLSQSDAASWLIQKGYSKCLAEKKYILKMKKMSEKPQNPPKTMDEAEKEKQ